MVDRNTAVGRTFRVAATAAFGVTLAALSTLVSAETRSGGFVADFSGYPPFKREWRSNEEITEIQSRRSVSSTASEDRMGPPGKKQFAARNAAGAEVVFARFEEVEGRPTGRTWRGTPGKLNHRPR
jgi:hypothetical protein